MAALDALNVKQIINHITANYLVAFGNNARYHR